MNKKIVPLLLAVIVSPVVIADDFADFKAQELKAGSDFQMKTEQAFKQYQLELEAGFKDFQKTYLKESQKYSQKMTKQWGNYKESSKDTWVNYSQDGKIRESVNFATGEVEIEILVDKKTSTKQVVEQAKENVKKLLATTEKQAFENDVVAKKVEVALKKHASVVETAKLSDKVKVMAPLVGALKTADDLMVEQLAKEMTGSASTTERNLKGKKLVKLSFKIPSKLSNKAGQYSARVLEIAKKENVPVPLVYAVMETESNFNPRAKSHVPAYGLMQIVPRSAGKDATKYLFGKARVLAPSYLYNGDKNIEIGGAYLHILYHRYLRKIEDRTSRLFCAIAAYNTGSGNVAKSFVGSYNINKAAQKINKLSPRDVYRHLRKHLPHDETKDYIQRVARRMAKYQS
ncbi:MAG: transglycosylase SLT domain-containing protein [Methyloprofundus sp.]|nr:transglycosylase SLT domain-containing protein [Methyloprofundus sp.]